MGRRGPQLGLEAGCVCSFGALPTCSMPGPHGTACPRSPVLAPLTLAPSLGHAPASVPATSFLISAAHPVGGIERGREEREKSPRRESRRTTARWALGHQDAGRLNPEAKQHGAGRSPQGARPWARCRTCWLPGHACRPMSTRALRVTAGVPESHMTGGGFVRGGRGQGSQGGGSGRERAGRAAGRTLRSAEARHLQRPPDSPGLSRRSGSARKRQVSPGPTRVQ